MIALERDHPERADREPESIASSAPSATPENRAIAQLLQEIATLLAHQGASGFRVAAYQKASNMLRQMREPVRDVLDREGVAGLIALPTIGQSIAHVIEQYLRQGQMPLLDRLRGEDTAQRVFETLPTVGPELSRRIHDQLEIETLPELMAATRDGRLATVPGIGRKRVRAIGECLALRLQRTPPRPVQAIEPSPTNHPVPISELLDVDAEYRRLAAKGKLPKIAPRRFNPEAIAWLPILHTHRGNRHYTALYSNTMRAHELNTTKDWVVIYRDDPESHGRWTVITSQFGKLRGWRIVRGREDECAAYYLQNR